MKEIQQKMSCEDFVSLESARIIVSNKSERQSMEATKRLMLSCSRLRGLKEELSSVTGGIESIAEVSQLSEVRLSHLRVPISWTSDRSKRNQFAVFCVVR